MKIEITPETITLDGVVYEKKKVYEKLKRLEGK